MNGAYIVYLYIFSTYFRAAGNVTPSQETKSNPKTSLHGNCEKYTLIKAESI